MCPPFEKQFLIAAIAPVAGCVSDAHTSPFLVDLG
jgi:hypothetical protein